MTDTYSDLRKILKELNPFVEAREGERIALVAAFVQPSDDYRSLLAMRRLLEEYEAGHSGHPGIECFCSLCERARVLTNHTKKPTTLPLPLEGA